MTKQVSPGIHLITTAPTLTKCRRCKRDILAATVGGLDRHVDTATLSDVGELAALMQGCTTYALVAEDYLARRTVEHIQGGSQRPVLADHRCAEIPDHHVDYAWTEYAKALCLTALGATVTSYEGSVAPPF